MQPDKNLRHLSAREVAILTGFPKSTGWEDSPRLMLAGVRQLASPLQAAWVFAQLRNHLIDSKLLPGPQVSPKEILTLATTTTELFDLRDQWAAESQTVTTQLFQEQFDEWLLTKEPKVGTPKAESAFVEEMSYSQEADLIASASKAEQHANAISIPPDVEDDQGKPQSNASEPADSAPKDENDCDPCTGDAVVQPVQHTSSPVDSELPDRRSNQPASDVVQPAYSSSRISHAAASVAEPPKPSPGANDQHVQTEHASVQVPPGAISAFAPRPVHQVAETLVAPCPHAATSVVSRPLIQMPPQVCNQPQELLDAGVMIYDLDHHQITCHKCSPSSTVDDWLQASRQIQLEYPVCLDMFGCPLPGHAKLSQVKWMLVGYNQVSTHSLTLPDRTHALHRIPRLESILLQGPAVASDEMIFYLQSIASVGLAKVKPPFILDGMSDLHIDAQHWITDNVEFEYHRTVGLVRYAHEWMQHVHIHEATATAIWVNNHWIPIWMVPSSNEICVHTTFQGAQVWELLFPWWPSTVNVHDDLPKCFPEDCGFRAFAWLVAKSTQTEGVPLTPTEAFGWRHLFWQKLVTCPSTNPYFVLGGQSELETALQALLRSHGVFPHRLQDRSSSLLKAFSHQALSGVFHAPRPWQLASTQQPHFRLVMEDELQATIKARTKDKKSVQAKAKQGRSQPVQNHVSPEDVIIPHGIFCLTSGEPLAQISSKQLGQSSQGVVPFTEAEVQPFLQHHQSGAGGLGFLVFSPYSEAMASQGQVVRFPVQSGVTAELMLVSAVLIQKGNKQVVRNMPAQVPAVEQVATQTIKCLLYRDQVTEPWPEVIAKPVKFIISKVECLQVCKQPECSCPKWHPDTQQSDTPILDVWQRDFLTVHFQKTRPSDAQLYTVAMRVTHAVYQKLFALSGTDGLFFEPRTDDGRGQDQSYHTVWVPRQPINEVKALQAMQNVPTTLIRVTHRYGLKVATAHAEHLHTQINPNDPYIAGASKLSFRVGPFPWGTTKKAMQQLFQQWGWAARAVHTVAKAQDASGLMWLVHAAGPPASLVFQLQHGDGDLLRLRHRPRNSTAALLMMNLTLGQPLLVASHVLTRCHRAIWPTLKRRSNIASFRNFRAHRMKGTFRCPAHSSREWRNWNNRSLLSNPSQ